MKHKLLSREEYDIWLRDIHDCPFCAWQENQIVLKEFEHWVWIASRAPVWNWHTMIIPKRHFVEFTDQTFKEAAEMIPVISYAQKKMLEAKLIRPDGSLVEMLSFQWRFRANSFDPVAKVVKPNHFHLNIAPDKDHLYDPIRDKEAYQKDVFKRLGYGRGKRVFL